MHTNTRYSRSTIALCLMSGAFFATLTYAGEGKSEHTDNMIKMMDANQDGEVTRAEHAAGAKQMFQRMDADQDGKVSEAEMTAHHQEMLGEHKQPHMKEMSSSEKIHAVDKNKDGLLTAEEHRTASTEMFGKMDQDKDGVLTAAEIDAGHKKMMSSAHDH